MVPNPSCEVASPPPHVFTSPPAFKDLATLSTCFLTKCHFLLPFMNNSCQHTNLLQHSLKKKKGLWLHFYPPSTLVFWYHHVSNNLLSRNYNTLDEVCQENIFCNRLYTLHCIVSVVCLTESIVIWEENLQPRNCLDQTGLGMCL